MNPVVSFEKMRLFDKCYFAVGNEIDYEQSNSDDYYVIIRSEYNKVRDNKICQICFVEHDHLQYFLLLNIFMRLNHVLQTQKETEACNLVSNIVRTNISTI